LECQEEVDKASRDKKVSKSKSWTKHEFLSIALSNLLRRLKPTSFVQVCLHEFLSSHHIHSDCIMC
jgi:hypothetical protein